MADRGSKDSSEDNINDVAHIKEYIEANISITINGPPTFQLGEENNHILTATLQYHNALSPSTSRSPPLPSFTFKEDGSPICTVGSLTGAYRLYPLSPPNAEPIHFDSVDFDLDDDPKPVTAANGFSTIRPGESITRALTMVPSCFDAKPGVKYMLRMPGGYGLIEWWGIGEMEAFEGAEVRCTEWSEDGGLKVGLSNEIEVLAET